MIGNVRESFQRNCSVHDTWNRGTAVHGVHFLRVLHNFVYNSMGHTFFIEDGVESFNRLEGNLAIKVLPSNALLNTDQTPAGFWIVSGANYIINNVAVASRRYGMWFRPERSATGTSVNTLMAQHPINIPLLEFRGNEVHSNGKYGLRIFDIYQPTERSVFRNQLIWRNAGHRDGLLRRLRRSAERQARLREPSDARDELGRQRHQQRADHRLGPAHARRVIREV
jgi:hypothetical protein